MLFIIYRFLTSFLAPPFLYGLLWWRCRQGKELPARLSERFGQSFHPYTQKRPCSLIWIHGASVGESLSALALIEALLKAFPSLTILVTTGTVTSAALLKEKLPDRAFHQFVPLDREPWVRRFLNTWRPSLALWIESELWPNLIWETTQKNIPLIMINGHLSEKSHRNWQRGRGLIKSLLARFSFCLAQTQADKDRLEDLGATNVQVIPTLKFATTPLSYDADEETRLQTIIKARPVWLAASTHHPEEKFMSDVHLALKAYFPDLLTLLIPRHPHRGNILQAQLSSRLSVSQRSKSEPIKMETDLYLIDTLGESGLFYHLCPLVFMGGSLVPVGGHNLIEPAHFKAVILHGPHMDNTRDVTILFHQAQAALQVNSCEDLIEQLRRLLQNPQERQERGQAALTLVRSQHRVLTQVLDALEPYLSTSLL